MMSRKFIWGAIACGLGAVLACSSSSSNGNNGGGSGGTCAETISGTAGTACGTCETSNCSTEISGIESGCSDLLSCVCPGGTYNASLLQGCASKAEESSCTTASQAMSTCANTHCASQCAGGTGSSSGGSSSGSSSSGSSSSGSSSSGGATPGTVASCQVTSQNTCYVFKNGAPETATGDAEDCSALLGGSIVSACPTAGLLGCCDYTSPSDYECYYTGSGVTQCPQRASGWDSTTLP